MELIRNQKPGGHEEDRASFPNQSQYKVSRTIALKSTPMKGRRRTGRRKRRRQGEGAACLGARQRKPEREWVSRYLCPLTLELKD